MKVVLKRDVKGVGKAHEVKNVSDGYARNFLIPRGWAEPATEGSIKEAAEYTASQHDRAQRVREQSEQLAEKIKAVSVDLTVKAGETGRLYGSITAADVAKAASKLIGTKLDKKSLQLSRPIRQTGKHVIDVKLPGGIRTQLKVNVTTETE